MGSIYLYIQETTTIESSLHSSYNHMAGVYTKGASQVPYFVNNAVMPKIVGNNTVMVAIVAIPIQ